MKYHFFILPMFIFFMSSCNKDELERIHEGDVYLNSQDAVEQFGLEGYTKVIGRVEFNGSSLSQKDEDITDISSIRKLKEIDGNLHIGTNESLTSLNGLNNLISVSQGITIYGTALTHIDDLSNLNTVGGSIGVIGNYSLKSIDGFRNISSFSSIVTVSNNPELENLNGLASLSIIGGLSIHSNHSLKNLGGLENLTSIVIQEGTWLGEGSLIIGNNNSLTSLSGLNQIIHIDDEFHIIKNKSLTDISSLSSLTLVGNELEVSENEKIPSLNGLEELSSIKIMLSIHDNTSLLDLCALKNAAINSGVKNFNIVRNGYNPSKQDIAEGICTR